MGARPGKRVLVAGLGNLFLGDDGFGPEVARRLVCRRLPDGVRVVDYGIRGMHLSFDLLDEWDVLVIIDAIPSRGAPGTVHLLSVDASDVERGDFDAHGMEPASMLAGVASIGGTLPPTYLVGCEVADVGERIGLSAPVADAVDVACAVLLNLVGDLSVRADAGVEG